MTATQQIETVLVGTAPSVTGYERIVAAIFDGDDLYIPLDTERNANQDLLASPRIYVRDPESSDRCVTYDVRARQMITDADRGRLEAHVDQPLSATTDVLHASLVGSDQAVPVASGFVCVIDGSERAGRALGPAQSIADWYQEPLVVCAVREQSLADEAASEASVHRQVDQAGISRSALQWVDRPDLEIELSAWARKGYVTVCAAFGSWDSRSQLYGLINDLVADDTRAVVGIGPNVPEDWAPIEGAPIAIFVDGSDHAADIVLPLAAVLPEDQSPLTVVHIAAEDPPDLTVANAVADELMERYDRPIAVRNIHGCRPSDSIAPVASTLNAQIAVLLSWHRRTAGKPTVASTSLISVAKAQCPVLVLSAP